MIEPTRFEPMQREPTQIESTSVESMRIGPIDDSLSIRDRLNRFGLFAPFEAAVLSQDPVAVLEVLLRANMTLVDADLLAHTMCRHTPRAGMLVS